jgi:hypothetical protein
LFQSVKTYFALPEENRSDYIKSLEQGLSKVIEDVNFIKLLELDQWHNNDGEKILGNLAQFILSAYIEPRAKQNKASLIPIFAGVYGDFFMGGHFMFLFVPPNNEAYIIDSSYSRANPLIDVRGVLNHENYLKRKVKVGVEVKRENLLEELKMMLLSHCLQNAGELLFGPASWRLSTMSEIDYRTGGLFRGNVTVGLTKNY